jgi:hypothetical protein
MRKVQELDDRIKAVDELWQQIKRSMEHLTRSMEQQCTALKSSLRKVQEDISGFRDGSREGGGRRIINERAVMEL